MFRTSKSIYLFFLVALSAFSVMTISAQKPAPTPKPKEEKKEKKKKPLPNFTGTYVLDEARSYDIETNVLKQKLRSADPKRKVTNLLVIDHREPEINITVKQRIEIFDDAGKLLKTDELVQSEKKYFTDKRGEKNTYPGDNTYGSTTNQSGRDIFVVIAADVRNRSFNNLNYSLSKDGSEITLVNIGYKVEPDWTTGSTVMAPSALRSNKYYVKVN